MLKYLICLFVFTLILSNVFAQNHMDIMTTMVGEHSFAGMGRLMTTLDWNGDGHDDLIVLEQNWDPRGYTPSYPPFPYGKLLIYLGGVTFDNVPEIVIPGHHEIEYGHTSSMCNAGDMNGDGYDELALFRATMYEDNFDQFYDLQLCVYNGRANPDTIPDYVLTFPREEYDNGYGYVRGLGDVNHDGYDDLGYIVCGANHYQPNSFRILYGDNQSNYENTIFQEAGSQSDFSTIIGLGDVNADGISDFGIGYLYEYSGWIQRIMLFYGNETGVYSDSVVIAHENIGRVQIYPVGDLNHDGADDFVSHFSTDGSRLYWGNPAFNPANFLLITPTYNGDAAGEGFGHGDVNGDGAPDIMGTSVTQANGYGDAYLWMGGTPMNGDTDLHITPDFNHDMEMFGWCLTMGDYNGDGYCDAAISAPFNYSGTSYPGTVFVYAGNSQLNDPMPIDDDTATPVVSKLQLYPNPLDPQQSNLNVRFTTPFNPPSGRGVESSTFEIYNIKGQKVKSFILTAEQTRAGSADFHLNDLSSGVYLCTYANGERILKGKITILP